MSSYVLISHIFSGLVGLVLAPLTVFSGSLFIAIALPVVIDLTSGRIMGRATQNDDASSRLTR